MDPYQIQGMREALQAQWHRENVEIPASIQAAREAQSEAALFDRLAAMRAARFAPYAPDESLLQAERLDLPSQKNAWYRQREPSFWTELRDAGAGEEFIRVLQLRDRALAGERDARKEYLDAWRWLSLNYAQLDAGDNAMQAVNQTRVDAERRRRQARQEATARLKDRVKDAAIAAARSLQDRGVPTLALAIIDLEWNGPRVGRRTEWWRIVRELGHGWEFSWEGQRFDNTVALSEAGQVFVTGAPYGDGASVVEVGRRGLFRAPLRAVISVRHELWNHHLLLDEDLVQLESSLLKLSRTAR